jgi:hypothetical protein
MNNSRWMKWGVLVLSLVLALPGLALAQTGSGGGTGNGNGNGNGAVNGRGGNSTFRSNNPMPVLIYTTWGLNGSGSGSGSGVSTSSDVSTLVVYDNGLATWSQSNADGSGNSGCSGNCLSSVQLSSSQVNTFVQSLRRAGAFRQSSNNGSAGTNDDTLVTITVFSYVQGSVSTANTVSFFTSGGQSSNARMAGIQNSFSGFFNTNFGTTGSGSGSGSGSGGGGS